MKNFFKFAFIALILSASLTAHAQENNMEKTTKKTTPEISQTSLDNTIYLDLKDGRVEIELFPNVAPKHVARIKELAKKGFYDGIVFHRVIEGFMAQTGDPTGTGMGGSGQKLQAEFNNEPHTRGTVSMARAADPDSADSQFFICLQDSNFLDREYTVFGRVTKGMEFVDKIKKGAGQDGKVSSPDKIIKMQVAADLSKPQAKKVAK
jgi:cyclophilin family peptidyl-prolyl cis-trans isomerase